MDTLIKKIEYYIPFRTCEYVLTLSLFTLLVLTHTIFQPPIFANDLIANKAVNSNTLIQMSEYVKEGVNPELKKEKFNERINQKYRGLKVTTVADGIKHIKMVKYYNGKPVRINVVEVNQEVAQN